MRRLAFGRRLLITTTGAGLGFTATLLTIAADRSIGIEMKGVGILLAVAAAGALCWSGRDAALGSHDTRGHPRRRDRARHGARKHPRRMRVRHLRLVTRWSAQNGRRRLEP
jgi:hypothetical protein